MKKIELGDIACDRLSGFRGVVVAVTEWLYGCRRITLQPRDLKDGKPIESQTFDDPQCEVLEEAAFERYVEEPRPVASTATGGPRPEPERGR